MDARLIELVKKNPILYDPAHKKYTDSTLKIDVWSSIAKQLKLKDATACKMKWNGLRDNYRKHLRKNRIRRAQGKKPTVFKYSDQFKFLSTFYEKCAEDSKDSKENVLREVQVKQEVESCGEEGEEDEDTKPGVGAAAGDGVDAFLAGLAPMLRALAPHQLSLAKAELFAVAHRHEARALRPVAPPCRCGAARAEPPEPPVRVKRRRSSSPEQNTNRSCSLDASSRNW